jgi:AraC-like DNA-binding protein
MSCFDLTISTMQTEELKRLQTRDEVHGMVPVTLVNLLAGYLQQRQVPLSKIMGKAYKQSPMGTLDRFPAEAFCQMLMRAAQHLDDPLLGLHLGQTLSTLHLGALGYVFQSCENVGQVLIRAERYHRLVHDINPIEHRLTGDNIEVCWGTTRGKPGALFDETGITAIIKLARDLCGQTLPLTRVDFVNPAPRQVQPYRAFFGCPVHFGQAVSRLVIPLSYMALPLAQPDPMLLKLMEDQVNDAVSRLPDEGDLADVTCRVVANLAKDGMPELEQVAYEMRMTPRVLYRRLAAQGLNFRELRESALQQLAEQHLRDGRLSLADVALLLGYSEQSAFTRAFKRWTGHTPTQWREEQAQAR